MKRHLNKDGKPFFRKGKQPIQRQLRLKLEACAIRHASGEISRGFRSHYELRSKLGYEDAKDFRPGDVPGFVTNSGEFLTRSQAIPVAIKAGQIPDSWLNCQRELLSSDINWNKA